MSVKPSWLTSPVATATGAEAQREALTDDVPRLAILADLQRDLVRGPGDDDVGPTVAVDIGEREAAAG